MDTDREEQAKFYATYKFYDDRGRRLAIFATPIKEEYLEIYVVTCGEKDQFTKKRANLIFQGRKDGNSLKGYDSVRVSDNKPKYTFIQWCEENYYKLVPATFEFEAKVFVKGQKSESPEFLDDVVPIGVIRPSSIMNKRLDEEEVK